MITWPEIISVLFIGCMIGIIFGAMLGLASVIWDKIRGS